MPRYEFTCEQCGEVIDLFCSMAEKKDAVKKIKCEKCSSTEIQENFGFLFNFSNPEGTDRWNSESTGHDYRFKHNYEKPGGTADQRKNAERHSHVGDDPYRKIDDINGPGGGNNFGEVK